MAITLDGTNGILSPDFEPSSSTTPTNGLFLPAANTVGLATGSTERLRIDSSGNLGLGVTPSTWGTAEYKAAQIGNGASFYGRVASGDQAKAGFSANAYHDGTNWRYISSYPASRFDQISGGHYWYTAPSGTAGNAISFTQAMTLDASGNLGVGTTSTSSSKVSIQNTAGNTTIGSSLSLLIGGKSNASVVGERQEIGFRSWNNYNSSSGSMAGMGIVTTSTAGNELVDLYFYTAQTGTSLTPVERARIDSSGNLLVGATSSFGAGVQSKTTSASLQSFTAWNAVDSGQAYLFYGGTGSASFTARYQIYWNFTGGTGTAGFLSDYRQKDNVRRLTNGLDAIKALKPSIYRFKDALEDASGFIAHEVQEVIPQAVSGHKDEVDEDGTPKYQMLDQTHIIPYLTAAIQELTARLEALEAK